MIERDYVREAKGLRFVKGDRLIDVLEIWDYRLGCLSAEGKIEEFVRCGESLIPELNRIALNKKTGLGLRATMAQILCSLVLLLDKNTKNCDEKTYSLLEITIDSLSHYLDFPIALWGKKKILETTNSLKRKNTLMVFKTFKEKLLK
jgi:hypothetical protein